MNKQQRELEDLLNNKKLIDKKKSSIAQISHFVNNALKICSNSDFSEIRQHLIAVLNLLNKIDGKMTSRSNTTMDFIEKAKNNSKNWNEMLKAGLTKKLLEIPIEEEKSEDGTEL